MKKRPSDLAMERIAREDALERDKLERLGARVLEILGGMPKTGSEMPEETDWQALVRIRKIESVARSIGLLEEEVRHAR